MNILSQYVLKVGAYLLFAMLMEAVMPAGAAKKYVKLVLGLLFMYVLIQPVAVWIQSEIPLETLTMAEAAQVSENPYTGQAQSMMQQGYEQALMQQGLPDELLEDYQLEEVEWGDVVKVTLSSSQPVGGLIDRSLDLGQIGLSSSHDTIRQSLCSYWGLPEEQVELTIR